MTHHEDPELPGARQAVKLIQTFVAEMSCYATALELQMESDAKRKRLRSRPIARRRRRRAGG